MAFALAIRNTVSKARQTFLTTTSLIVIGSVIFIGGSVTPLLHCFGVPVGVEEEGDQSSSTPQNNTHSNEIVEDGGTPSRSGAPSEKAWLARIWGGFDSKYMKPLLTHSKPTLVETMPGCCLPLAKMLTSSEQLQEGNSLRPIDSDIELCIDDNDNRSGRSSVQPGYERVFFLNNKTDDEDHLLFYPMVSPDPHSFTTIVKKFPGAGV